MPAWVVVRVVDGLLEGEFVCVPMGCPFPIRLPNELPTERPMMFDPSVPKEIMRTTAYYLLPIVEGVHQLAVTRRPPPPLSVVLR
jgi:hypothetical protein